MEEIFDDVVYFKGKTFFAYLKNSKCEYHRIKYLEDGSKNPKAFFEWLDLIQNDIKQKDGLNAVVTYCNIL